MAEERHLLNFGATPTDVSHKFEIPSLSGHEGRYNHGHYYGHSPANPLKLVSVPISLPSGELCCKVTAEICNTQSGRFAEWLGLVIEWPTDSIKSCVDSVAIHILNSNAQKHITKRYGRGSAVFGLHQFAKLSDLKLPSAGFLVNDNLTIMVDVYISH